MNRTHMAWGVGIVLILGVSAIWQFRKSAVEQLPAPAAGVSGLPAAEGPAPQSLEVKAVSVTPASHPIQTSVALVPGESVVSWDFKGAYTGSPELMAKAQNEIARLSALLATATSSAMILNVSVANQYELMGDGKNQYEYLGRAIQANATEGLPWHNLGVLMERLGALQTARIAYEKAALVQPQLAVYHYSYLQFLIQSMKDDAADIEKAFTAAEKNIGSTQYLAELRAEWEKP